MVIAIDFDGTCVTHDFPYVGKDIGSQEVLKKLVEAGNDLILWTMRSDTSKGSFLKAAVKWFEANDIPLYGVQRNPTQDSWTSSPKCYAEIFIDDAALGCPLKFDSKLSNRPFVDWTQVEYMLTEMGAL
jgi:hypothetical protein